jgi:hypothetical protein
MWKKFEQILALRHVFTAPYNSHGLQLVIKDLLKRPTIELVFKDALQIVNGIQNAGKQQSFL